MKIEEDCNKTHCTLLDQYTMIIPSSQVWYKPGGNVFIADKK